MLDVLAAIGLLVLAVIPYFMYLLDRLGFEEVNHPLTKTYPDE